MPGSPKHLLSLKELDSSELDFLLERGMYWSDTANARLNNPPKVLDNPIICNLFFENSTRTKFSFVVAAKKLGYHVLDFHAQVSSTQKGETLYDTLCTLEAMGVSVAIIRTTEENILNEVSGNLNLSIVNAGAGANEHPTQALLDVLTMKQQFGKIEGLNVAIVGDIIHSRVANSNMVALERLGANVMLAGPQEWLPDPTILAPNTKICDVDEAMQVADVVMMLRVQRERHALSTCLENYLENYGLNKQREANLKEHTVVMHPAPFNRGVEIDGDLVEGPRSLIYRQVANGVAIRMAVLERALSNA